jgi:hypothetical protein
MSIEKPDQPGQRYRRDCRLGQGLYRVESAVKPAVGDAREISGKQKVEDLTLSVSQDAVAQRDSLDDQEYSAAPLSGADDLLPGANRSADRLQVEQDDQLSGDRREGRG